MTSLVTRIKEFVAPPVFPDDEDKTRTAMVLNTLLLALMVFLILGGGIAVSLFVVEKLYNGLLLLAFFLALVVARWLMRRGRVRLASAVLVSAWWAIFTGFLPFAGGMTSIAAVFYVSGPVLAGLLLGTRAAWINALACILAGLVMVVLESSGHSPPRIFPVPATAGWVDMTLSLLLVTMVLNLVLRGLNDALALARRQVEEREKAEEALRESEAKHRNLVENINDALFATDENGVITYISPPIEPMSGYSPSEIIGRPFGEFLSEEDLPRLVQRFQKVLSGHIEAREYRIVTKSGESRWVRSSSRPILVGNRRIGLQGTLTDITERKRAEEALRESEERFRDIFENATIGLYRTTPDGRILMANPTLVHMLGYSSFEEFAQRDLSKEGYEPEYPRSVFQQRIESEGQVVGLESAWVRRDGTRLFIRESAKAVRDEAGNTLYYEGTVEDVTERRRAEEALRESEHRLRSFINSSPDTIYILDLVAHEIVYFNRDEFCGYSRDELTSGNSILHAVHPDDLVNVGEHWQRMLEAETDEPSPIEYRLQAKDGALEWIQDRRIILSRDAGGAPAQVLVTLSVITERKQAEQQLRVLSSVVEQSANSVAILNKEGIVQYANPKLLDLYRISPEEVIGKNWRSFLPMYSNLREKLAEIRDTVLERGTVWKGEVTDRAKSGEVGWRAATIFPIKDASGEITHAVYTSEDITERKQAQEALRESREKYREMIDGMNDTVWVIGFDGRFVDINETAARALGYSREELLSMGPADIDSHLTDEQIRDLIQRMPSDEIQVFETEHTTKEGETIPVEISSSLVTYQGRRAILSIARDITERKRAEQALHKSEQRYRALVDNLNEVIFSLDTQGRFTYLSPAMEQFSGYTVNEIIGTPFTCFILPEDLAGLQVSFERTLGGQKEPYEFRVIIKDGTIRHVLTSSSLVMEQGQPVGLIGVMTDITGRKQAEEELQRSFERLQRSLEGTVNVLVSAIELRDPYTAGHQRRSTQLACAIAKEMGFSQEQVEVLRMAGLIHDIGKITIPAEILSKPSQLRDIEWALIKAHPEVGYNILKAVEFPWPVAEIVLQHHERLNGSGYPQGLSGNGILIRARILAVADVVEAMASHRPYRPTRGLDMALEEVSQNRGVLYDPEAVDACLKLFAEKGFEFE